MSEIDNFKSHMATEYPELPALRTHKEVCPCCHGEGTTGPGWVFTEEDRYEMGSDFDDLMHDLRRGTYDRNCPTCDSLRVVDVADDDQHPETLRQFVQWMQDVYEDAAVSRMERMMGA